MPRASETRRAVRTPRRWYLIIACLLLVGVAIVLIVRPCAPAYDLQTDASLRGEPTTSPSLPPLFVILVDGKRGYMDRSGQVVIPPFYAAAENGFIGELASAQSDGNLKWGYINRAGQWAIPPQFGAAYPFSEQLAAVLIDGDWGFIDPRGSLVIPAQWDIVGGFRNGVAKVGIETTVSKIKRGFADVGAKCTWSFIDRSGNHVPWDVGKRLQPDPPQDSLRAAEVDGLFGFVDTSGAIVIEPRYTSIKRFSHGLAAAQLGDHWGFIDRTGLNVIPHEFDAVVPFVEGTAAVKLNGKWALIDCTGQYLAQPQFDWIRHFGHGLWQVGVNKKKGYVDKTGKWIWKPTN